jgi:hypothetical protein
LGRSILNSFQFATADDGANRDPMTITIEGTNKTSMTTGSSWTLIYNGETGISSTNLSRSVYCPIQSVANIEVYRSYRVLVTSQRGSDTSVQYSEMHLIGTILP